MARLATHVHVPNENGGHTIFGPEDEVPAWAVALITNPLAWADGEVPAQVDLRAEEPATPPVKRAAPQRKAAADGAVRGG